MNEEQKKWVIYWLRLCWHCFERLAFDIVDIIARVQEHTDNGPHKPPHYLLYITTRTKERKYLWKVESERERETFIEWLLLMLDCVHIGVLSLLSFVFTICQWLEIESKRMRVYAAVECDARLKPRNASSNSECECVCIYCCIINTPRRCVFIDAYLQYFYIVSPHPRVSVVMNVRKTFRMLRFYYASVQHSWETFCYTSEIFRIKFII